MTFWRDSIALPVLALIVFVVVLIAMLLSFNRGPELMVKAERDQVSIVKEGGQIQPLAASDQRALTAGEGVQVDETGWATLSFGDGVRAEVYQAGRLEAVAVDPAAALITLRHTLGTIFNEFDAGQTVAKRLTIETELTDSAGNVARVINTTATGTKFIVSQEKDTGLVWIVALEATEDDLTVDTGDDAQALPVSAGFARWVAPLDQPSAPIPWSSLAIEPWLAGLRSGVPQPDLGEVILAPADDEIDGVDLQNLGIESLTRGIPLMISLADNQGLLELTLDPGLESGNPTVEVPLADCNGDGLLDIPVQNNEILRIDFRQTAARVRRLEVTVLNRAGPFSGWFRVFDPAFEKIPFPFESLTAAEGEEQRFNPATNRIYHYAYLSMADGCFLDLKLVPPAESPSSTQPAATAVPSVSLTLSPTTLATLSATPGLTTTPVVTQTATPTSATRTPRPTASPTAQRSRTPTSTPTIITPRLIDCRPRSVRVGETVDILCTGQNFRPDQSGFRVELLGHNQSVVLPIREATRTSFRATVSATLPVGRYDLLVINPDDRADVRLALFEVVETSSAISKVSFLASAFTATEDDEVASMTVILDHASSRTVTVDYTTGSGTAVAGQDYQPVAGTLTFAPGQTRQTIEVTLLDDLLDEADETVNLRLRNPANAALDLPVNATLTIFDDDPRPTVQFESSGSNVTENAGPALITVTLSAPSGREVRVDYATHDGTAAANEDYTPISGTLVFEPGTTHHTLEVPLIDDNRDEPAETVALSLSQPLNVELGSPAETVVTITDDDEPPVIRFEAAAYDVAEPAGTITLIVRLDHPSSREVRVDLATQNGTATAGADYVAANSTLIFAPGEITRTAAVTLIDDELDEAAETIKLSLSNPSNASLGSATAVLTILDDDPEPAIQFSAETFTVEAGSEQAIIEITLARASGRQVTVDYATADGTAKAGEHYTATRGSLTLTPGAITGTFPIPLLAQAIPVGENLTVTLTLSNPVNTTLSEQSQSQLFIKGAGE